MNSESVTVTVENLPSWTMLERQWMSLENRATASFFISWGWIGTWLKSLPAFLQPRLLRIIRAKETIGLGVLIERKYFRHRILPVRETHLNSTGIKYYDTLFIEYNDFLMDGSFGITFKADLLPAVLGKISGEEFHASGVVIKEYWSSTLPLGFRCLSQKRKCFGVDLIEVRAKNSYLALISANSRNKIRRAFRDSEQIGTLHLEVAQNLEQAEVMYGNLCQLHRQAWEARGQSGAFSNGYLHDFHLNLIRNRMSHGEIQIISLFGGTSLLGVIYNFVYRGHVYNYQSGIDYTIGSKHLKPGLMIHAMAIEYNAQNGHSYYDLMEGQSQYKRTLSTRAQELQWLVFQPTSVKFKLESGLRVLKQYLHRKIS